MTFSLFHTAVLNRLMWWRFTKEEAARICVDCLDEIRLDWEVASSKSFTESAMKGDAHTTAAILEIRFHKAQVRAK